MDVATVGLISGAVGVVGTFAGVTFTQWRSDRRDRARLDSEERREAARLAHDADLKKDERLFDHRRTAYTKIVEHYHGYTRAATEWDDHRQGDPPEDALEPFWLSLSEVDLYGTQTVSKAALNLYWAVYSVVFGAEMVNMHVPDPDLDAYFMYAKFVEAARQDLGLPPREEPIRREYPLRPDSLNSV
ncbi:MAG: hypothetical protein F2829_03465 [Actinobacteria bacterium]|nr:hypothetical protein [Actinomycetota bacterium]